MVTGDETTAKKVISFQWTTTRQFLEEKYRVTPNLVTPLEIQLTRRGNFHERKSEFYFLKSTGNGVNTSGVGNGK